MVEELLLPNATTTWFLDDAFQDPDGNQSIFFSSSTVASTVTTVADPAFVRFRDETRFWVQRVLLPIVATIGVFGNGATILVLTRRGMRSSTNAYLTALAIADLVYLLCVFWLSLRHYPQVREDLSLGNFYTYTWPYSLWLTDAATNTSVWLTVTFTVERYIAVGHPIRGRLLCTESRARRVIAAVYLICFTATLSTPFEWTVQEITDPLTNITKAELMPSHLGNDETYQTCYYWFTSISFVLLPLTLLIIFNSFLIHSVRQSQKLRQVMTQRQTIIGSDREERAASNEIRITVTLIAVVIMFLVCQLPTAATLIYKIFHAPEPQSNEEAVLRALGNIFNCLVSINAACNFVLYCALSDKYRRTFMWTFCRCLYRPASPVHSMAFFTQVDDYGGHHGNQINHSRQTSIRMNQQNQQQQHDRYNSRTGQHLIHRTSTGSAQTGPYLAIPDGNGSMARQAMSTAHRLRSPLSANRSRSPSLQSNISNSSNSNHPHGSSPAATLVTAVLASKVHLPRDCESSSSSHHHSRWSKWWLWQSSATKRTPSKTNNILIQISDVEDMSHHEPLQTREQRPQVNDEEVAFV